MPLKREQDIIDSGKSISVSDIDVVSKKPPKSTYVGIIPADGLKSTFEHPFPPCLLPVGKNINLLEASVMDCMWFRCRQIYIVGYRENLKLYRKTIGDHVRLPHSMYERKMGTFQPVHHVPIYYVPIHPKDRKKRDSLAWSALYGVITHKRVVHFLSEFLNRDGYFFSFPFGMYNPYRVDVFRSKITKFNNFFFNFEGKTVRDGLYLPFYLNNKEFPRLLKNVRKKMIEDGFFREESIRNEYTLKDVFNLVPPRKDDVSPFLPFYNEITTWEQYTDYLFKCKQLDFSLVKPRLFKPNRNLQKLY